ncbi:argonaute PAZ domain-containing protein [Thermosynechococcus sp. JY1334]|uniref:argonaute PAZ domain-containing protein n=1 Tax=unclassified Thermosynechococcus TaxID=2622553 RepID=UPI0026740AB3|nr:MULTISPECIES: argonaute PAZ domain-containing protein [unclassified Thermosynechococcus]MDR7898611.1 argonaute PAZ domain-containing protein [Thermosynechococcus sp. JY1332]MDR7906015.1 argonaute PAZ domain-containing protein [Thermosynechococcus sp. JY1334]MDR7993834.1 argonaute PAZ domain-containing protein [Thermosynechococcus sp. TG252]WKT85746.1 argonaute PAZ domain-containing protein [Thermosynechococcus sp. JY1339]WNC54690.1 argonaute PAZ domain-containing protein [Thermosynechococcu
MMFAQFREVEVILNRFFVKNLTQQDLTFYEYQCQFTQVPEEGSEQKALSSVCYKLGVTAVRLGNRIITRQPIDTSKMQTQGWQLQQIGCRELSCQKDHERQALESFERKILECKLKEKLKKARIEKDYEVGLIWWNTAEEGIEKRGDGWEVHKGGSINVRIEPDGKLYLEIDIHHRFYTPFTLEWWLKKYPDIQIKYVRNTYEDKKVWILENFSNKSPNDVEIKELGISLAAYHRQKDASEQEINESRVVIVRKTSDYKAKPVYHLSQRLSPILTVEILAQIAEQVREKREKSEIQGVFDCIRKNINLRLSASQKTAERIFEHIYNLSRQPELLKVNGFVMPRAKLLARNNKEINKTAEISSFGCAKIGETKFGCLNLSDDKAEYPEEVRKCLLQIAESSGTQIQIDYFFTKSEYPKDDLDQQRFWQQWADRGIKTVLVVMPWSPNEEKQKLRNQALKAGIATQFMVPVNVNDYKSLNVCLGLLCKAKWQPVYLKPLDHPEAADLIIGFDAGTNGRLYYGTSAFAVLANGQSLGWELPDVQRGETISGQAIWQVVSKLVLKFQDNFDSYPKKILLMRDGLIQKGEFEQTIEELNKKNIAVDILSVRKSGSGRMGRELNSGNSKITYSDAEVGTMIVDPKSKLFILQTSEAIKTKDGTIGSARPLRVVHTHGKTPLELLALQTYHLTQLHPASGFRSCRLPWVLHLADKSSKEFQRIGQISVLQNIDREKLIAV